MTPDEFQEIRHDYHRFISKKVTFSAICVAISFVAIVLSVTIGQYSISFLDSYGVIIDHILGRPLDEMSNHIIWELRMPRALMAVFVGAGLAVCGAAMQSMMRNPLADPYTTGVASGASLGAAVAIILGVCIIPAVGGQSAIVVNAFAFSLIPVCVIVLISKFKKVTPTTMILSGIAVMFIFSATTSMLMLAANPSDLAEVYIWTVGTLGKASWSNLPIVAAVTLSGLAVLVAGSKSLNILAMGDKGAKSLGVNPTRLRLVFMVTVAVMTATMVSFTGTIGFVGLVAPHVVRIFIGSDNKYLIPCSAAFGALFMICVDSVAKVVSNTGLPVGVITALVGGPIFLIILIKMQKRVWR
ncbi:MAG: iron ABC transporter permease [Methanomassiliicoccaceae archaeon]|nr:iron ABC transporter permease [Methanomassiliicoccaceae archaeon]